TTLRGLDSSVSPTGWNFQPCASSLIWTPQLSKAGRLVTSNSMLHNLHFPLRMAWRETRAATGKFLFVVLSVALGAAALTAVTGFNESVRYTLVREARTLMAADMALRMRVQPSPQALRFLDELAAKVVESTRVTEI